MNLENIKKNNEYVWAEVFVDFVNKQYDTKYHIVPELGENSPVDMHLVCEECEHKHIDLQLTHAIEVPFVALKEHMDVDYSQHPTIDAIERKTQKLSGQGADLSQIVLIVQGYMNQEMALEVFAHKAFQKYENSPFAGIYYVAPPMFSDETHEMMQDGVVMAIKDYFKNAKKD